MLCWISIFGGLLIMMGQHARSEALFYYFRLEDQIPENHLLRLMHTPIRPALVGPRWFAGSTLRFSADNRAFVVRTPWGRELRLDLNGGAIHAQ